MVRNCGVGFFGDLSKRPSRRIIEQALEMLVRLKHRGACGCEENTGLYRHNPKHLDPGTPARRSP